jgi:hypothetical protein
MIIQNARNKKPTRHGMLYLEMEISKLIYKGGSYIKSDGSKHNVKIPQVIKRPGAIRPTPDTSYVTSTATVVEHQEFCHVMFEP